MNQEHRDIQGRAKGVTPTWALLAGFVAIHAALAAIGAAGFAGHSIEGFLAVWRVLLVGVPGIVVSMDGRWNASSVVAAAISLPIAGLALWVLLSRRRGIAWSAVLGSAVVWLVSAFSAALSYMEV